MLSAEARGGSVRRRAPAGRGARALAAACSAAPACPRAWQLKQMAELEQEKEVLLQGLQMMARGRDWYQQQLQRVQERQRRLGRDRASAVSDTAPSPGRGAPDCDASPPATPLGSRLWAVTSRGRSATRGDPSGHGG